MTAADVLGRVDELTDGTGGSVDAVMGAEIGPYRKSRPRRLPRGLFALRDPCSPPTVTAGRAFGRGSPARRDHRRRRPPSGGGRGRWTGRGRGGRMSQRDVERTIGRLLKDADFRQGLF